MLTLSSLGGPSVRITGTSKPVNIYPKKIADGDVNLIASPEEASQTGVISWPGEYDVAGVTVRGIGQEEGQQVSYVIEEEGIRMAFPSLPLKDWSEADIAHMGDVHVLCLPACEPKLCQKLIDEVDPRMLLIVPDSDGKIDNEVLKLAGAIGKEQVKEYKVKGGFAAEGREVAVFA